MHGAFTGDKGVFMTSAARAHLLATTLLMGATTFATPALAQVQGDNSGILSLIHI